MLNETLFFYLVRWLKFIRYESGLWMYSPWLQVARIACWPWRLPQIQRRRLWSRSCIVVVQESSVQSDSACLRCRACWGEPGHEEGGRRCSSGHRRVRSLRPREAAVQRSPFVPMLGQLPVKGGDNVYCIMSVSFFIDYIHIDYIP